jgi:hypothetical protein
MSERFKSIADAEIVLFDTATFAELIVIAFGVAVTTSDLFVSMVTKPVPEGDVMPMLMSIGPAIVPGANGTDTVFVVPDGNGPLTTVEPNVVDPFFTLIVIVPADVAPDGLNGSNPKLLVTLTFTDPPVSVADATSVGIAIDVAIDAVNPGYGTVKPFAAVHGAHIEPRVRFSVTGASESWNALPATVTLLGRSWLTESVVLSLGITYRLVKIGASVGKSHAPIVSTTASAAAIFSSRSPGAWHHIIGEPLCLFFYRTDTRVREPIGPREN